MLVVEEMNEKNLKWIESHYQKGWKIYCLKEGDKKHLDFVDDCEFIDLEPYHYNMTKETLKLMEAELNQIDPIARELSSALNIDVSPAINRYLMRNYYYKKAKIKKIESIYSLKNTKAIYVGKNYIINDGFLNILPLDHKLSKYRLLLSLCLKAVRSLKNILKFKGNKADILFLMDRIEYQNIYSVLKVLDNLGVKYVVVDKSYENTLEDQVRNAEYFSDKFYKYFLSAVICYGKSLSYRYINNILLLNFIHTCITEKYRSQDLFDQFQFQVILSHNEYYIYQGIYYHQFKKNGSTVLNFMHGDKALELKDVMTIYDDFLVWGEYYKKHFEELRYKGKKITVVGSPAFDKINDYKLQNVKLLEIKATYKNIISLYPEGREARSEFRNDQIQMVNDIYNYARYRPNVFVFIKKHPVGGDFLYFNEIDNLKNIRICESEYELYDLISISDLIISTHSTVGLEGILFKKNVIYINYKGYKNRFPYWREGSVVEVNNRADFDYSVDGLLNETIELDPLKTIKLHANGLDGQATKHFYDEIVKYL